MKTRNFALVFLLLGLFSVSGLAIGQARLGLDVVDATDQKVGYALSSQTVVVFIDGKPHQIPATRDGFSGGGMIFYDAADCNGIKYMAFYPTGLGSLPLFSNAFFTTDGMLHYPAEPPVTLHVLSQRIVDPDGSGSCFNVDLGDYLLGTEVVSAANSTPPFRVVEAWPVSPAPATATFNDVPTYYPFFRYIEALYASGITAGCGNGNYCPTEPVTRGQMAVFLAKALGL